MVNLRNKYMENLKAGDIITFQDKQTLEVRARIDNIIFTREMFKDGSVGPTNEFGEIEDLVTMGWKKV